MPYFEKIVILLSQFQNLKIAYIYYKLKTKEGNYL